MSPPAPMTTLRDRLHAGPALVGTFLQVPARAAAETVAAGGVDFTCVEGEHSGLGVESITTLVHASERAGVPALVRVRANDPAEIAAALDAGAAGIVVPRVDSADEARRAVAAARFPPDGTRGLGPGRATGYGRATRDHLATANAAILVGVQVESRASLESVPDLAAVEGLDFLFVGPGDLALSLGVALGGAEVETAARSALEQAAAAGMPAGIWAPTAEEAATWIERGARIVIVGSDLSFLAAGLAEAVGRLRGTAAPGGA